MSARSTQPVRVHPYRPVMPAALAAGAFGGASMLPLFALPPDWAQGLATVLHVAALALVAALLVRSAAGADPDQRRSRRVLAASMLMVALGAAVSVAYVVLYGEIPVPSLMDPVILLWVPLAAYGLWRLPSSDGSSTPTLRLATDVGVAASALAFVSWLLVLRPIVGQDRWSGLAEAVQLAYPVTDIVIATIVIAILPRVRADQRDFLNAAASGLLLIAVADSAIALGFAQHGELRFGWPDVVLQAGFLLVAYGARVRRRPDLEDRTFALTVNRVVPYLPPLLAVSVGIGHVAAGHTLGLVETLMGAGIVSAMMLRQLVTVRELTVVGRGHAYAAGHDALTALPNRKAFIDELAERLRTPGLGAAAVAILDLDGFKAVNDGFGHDRGDRVLVDFARLLAQAASPHLAARLGGDEFALLVVDDQAEAEAERIALRVTRSLLPHAGGLTLGCSVGVTALRDGDSSADALRRADLAMFWAKRQPAVSVAPFQAHMAASADRRGMLLGQLPGASGRGELRLVYQPLFRVEDQRLVGAEALLRWRHPVLGDVSPAEFVPLAEESGEIRGMGAWVIDNALQQTAAWRRRGRLLPQVFVNVAAAQFTEELPQEVGASLARHGVSPYSLVLEITESQLPGLAANRAVQSLRRSGVRVAMDDFGSGYSSLAQLARLPVDILKIDRDAVANLGAEKGRVVLDSVVLLARALGLETIAEGVEEPEQAQAVREAEIDYQQGYLLARPLEADDLFALLAQPIPLQTRSSGYDGTPRRAVAGELG